MAIAKTTELVKRSSPGPHMSLLEFQVAEEDFGAFRGGRYIILNSGLPLEGDKTIKRAYSILDCDSETRRVTIGIKALDQGAASRYLANADEGQTFTYSGPWGKLDFPNTSGGRVLMLASYTGITALLGLAREVSADTPPVDFIWYRPDKSYFLDDGFAAEIAAKKGLSLIIRGCPEAHDPEHEDFFRHELGERLWSHYQRALLAGDGKVNRIARGVLEGSGLASNEILEEVFFNKAKA